MRPTFMSLKTRLSTHAFCYHSIPRTNLMKKVSMSYLTCTFSTKLASLVEDYIPLQALPFFFLVEEKPSA